MQIYFKKDTFRQVNIHFFDNLEGHFEMSLIIADIMSKISHLKTVQENFKKVEYQSLKVNIHYTKSPFRKNLTLF